MCTTWPDFVVSAVGDRNENELAVQNGDRIMSVHPTPQGKVYVITEWDRSVTTVLMAEDY